MFALAVLRSKPEQLYSQLEYIARFVHPDTLWSPESGGPFSIARAALAPCEMRPRSNCLWRSWCFLLWPLVSRGMGSHAHVHDMDRSSVWHAHVHGHRNGHGQGPGIAWGLFGAPFDLGQRTLAALALLRRCSTWLISIQLDSIPRHRDSASLGKGWRQVVACTSYLLLRVCGAATRHHSRIEDGGTGSWGSARALSSAFGTAWVLYNSALSRVRLCVGRAADAPAGSAAEREPSCREPTAPLATLYAPGGSCC